MSSPAPQSLPSRDGDRVSDLKQRLAYYVHLFGLRGKGSLLLAVLLALVWVNAGIYKVQPDEEGVVLRFGHWVENTGPGLHYHLPWPLETVLLPKVTQVNQLQLGNSNGAPASGSDDSHQRQMLTGDENIVEAECAVFWRIKDASQFLFRIEDPERAVKVAAESALREVIGRTPIQAAMSDKRCLLYTSPSPRDGL